VDDADLKLNAKAYLQSSLRESIIEHLFVGEILRALWLTNRTQVEVLKPQVDNSGYDLAVECEVGSNSGRSALWHIQLKSSHADAKRSSVNVSVKLTQKANWCVIWIFFDPKTLKLGSFYWIGARSGQTPFDMSKFKATKHTKGDAQGDKKERPGLRDVPKAKFTRLESIDDVIRRLFSETL
jgi:hypothetical protein